MPRAHRPFEEGVELVVSLFQQTALPVEELFGESHQGVRAIGPGPENNFPLSPITDINLRVGRTESGRQLAPRLAVTFQLSQCELDVLAGAQRVDGEIGARAVIVAQARAADRHPVGPPCLGVSYLEFGEDCLAADVLDLELLFPAVLPPQIHLPCLDRHLFRLAKPGELFTGVPAFSLASTLS